MRAGGVEAAVLHVLSNCISRVYLHRLDFSRAVGRTAEQVKADGVALPVAQVVTPPVANHK
jgi:hypothetical protein